MKDYTGWIVRATAGRDKDGIFCVVGMDQEGTRLLLADGRRRKISRPKPKKLGHVEPLTDQQDLYDHPAMEKLKQGQALTDKELRRVLAAFRAKEV